MFSSPRALPPGRATLRDLIAALCAVALLPLAHGAPVAITVNKTFRLRSYIRNNQGMNLCVDVPTTVDRAQLIVQECASTNSQLFYMSVNQQVVHFPSGQCVDVGTGLILGEGRDRSDPGNSVQLYRCTGLANQQWVVDSTGKIASLAPPGGCIDLAGGTDYAFPGRNIQTWTCNSTFDAQNGNQARLWYIDYSDASPSTLSTGAIVGIVIGSLAALALIAGGILWLVMSKRRGKAAPDVSAEPISEEKPAKAAPVLQQQVEANSPAAQKDQNPRQLPEQSTAQPSAIFSMFGGDLRRGDKAVDVFALAQATDNHSPASGTEVPLRIGDAVFVERAFANGWASGTNRTRGGQGFFPADFVQIVPERVGSLVEAAQAPPPNEVHASPAPLPAVLYAAERASPYADPRISPIGLPPPADIRASPAFAPLSVSPTAPAPSPDTAGFSVSIPNNGASPSDATPILSPTQPLQATMGFATVQGIPVQRSKLLVGSDDVRVDRSARLGGGGLGEVFLGVLRGSTRVAVRRLPEPMDRETTEVFAREVQGQEGLVQRNVLPLLAFSLQPPMLITDHLPDGNLRNFLLERGWDQPLGLSLLRDAAAGTAYLHAAGIVHGALRSTNVLVDGTRALVSGFGLAGLREKVGGGATVRSAAPEVLAGGGASKEADAYAFAMMCYEVLSDGALPFEGASDDLIKHVVAQGKRPSRPFGSPDAFWALVERCWAQDPRERPSFADIRDEMARFS